MTENKKKTIDELECNNCPDKKRCYKQRERKDNIINSMLDDIKDTAIAYNCDLNNKIKILKQHLPIITRCDVVLEKQLDRKTKECDELKKIIDEAKSSKLDLKSFLVGEAIQNEYEEQINQLKAENELLRQYKGSKQASYESMQVEWNKAVSQNKDLLKQVEDWQEKYKQLQTENEELERFVSKQKNAKIQLSKLKDKQYKEFCDMKQILIEIKEIVETENNDIKVLYNRRTYQRMKQILQKLSEVSNNG